MFLDHWMTKLAYSGILSANFQKWHLIVNYSILALALALYLIFDLPEWVTALGAVPGAIIFVISMQALSYRKAIEGDMTLLVSGLLQ